MRVSSYTPYRYSRRTGFTIVELLIVIVVIAILAAVTVVGYNGITKRATESAMKSDLEQAAKTLESDNILKGTYPGSATAANNGQGLQASPGTTLTYVQTLYGYCVSSTNPKTGDTFSIRSNVGQIQNGTCDGTVTTLAGSGTATFAEGTGTAASFSNPKAVTVDAAGTIYVADRDNNRIRKITPDGTVTTLAGSGTRGYQNGAGAVAQFGESYSLAVDTTSNVFVADSGNSLIRKITPAGVVSTFAGTYNVFGHVDGAAATAQFDFPTGISIDGAGNLYVGDEGGNRVRKITPSGTVSTIAGTGSVGATNGAGTSATFGKVRSVAAGLSGEVYVADADNNMIRKIASDGTVSTFAGSTTAGFTDGQGTAARFNYPTGLVVDKFGNVYVADANNSAIRRITPDGTVSTLAGALPAGYVDGVGAAVRFNGLRGITINSTGVMYIADSLNNRIRKLVQ